MRYLKLLWIAIFVVMVGCATVSPPGNGDPPPPPPPDPAMGYPPDPVTGKCSANATAGKILGLCYTVESATAFCTTNSFALYSGECAQYSGGKDH